MNEKILFVDDDPHIRRAIIRRQQVKFHLETAASGPEGLEILDSQGPFAVVLSDMRMPVMDGIEFLSHVKQRSPDTVRMMLTGNADLQTAINAVNEGNIFRFLTKPCPVTDLTTALRAGVEQYHLITTERVLLGKTLKGSIQVLSEILSLVNPSAFSRASRISSTVKDIVTHLQLPDSWQFELASMLSQVGCVTLPPDILNKIYEQLPLTKEEERLFQSHPSVGRQLLAHIPRLELVSQMIEGQEKPPETPISPTNLKTDEDKAILGAQLLKLALDFDNQVSNGLSHQDALSIMRQRRGKYNRHLVKALDHLRGAKAEGGIKEVTADGLAIGMVADQDIFAQNGLLLVHKGQEITLAMMIRLRNFAKSLGVVEPFRVKVVSQEQPTENQESGETDEVQNP